MCADHNHNEARESDIEETATGSECSDVREEGPILLTTNEVRGNEILPELRGRLKELRRDNVIRLETGVFFFFKREPTFQ